VATFWSPIEANLAKNRLEDAGLKAFLASGDSVNMAWHLTNALGGIQLQVGDGNAETALAILAEDNVSGPATSDQREEAPSSPSDLEESDERRAEEAAEAEPVLTSREQNAERAFRGAVFGLLMPPLQLYVFWLLLKVFVSDERLGAEERRKAIIGAVICLPMMLAFCMFIGAVVSLAVPS
jgi:hypothetical protein